MTNNITNSILFILLLLTTYSCKKFTDLYKSESLDELYESLKSSPQKFTVQAGTNSTIKCLQGTRLKFNPNSFKNQNGDLITSGNVDIEIIETAKANTMILNRVTTLTNSNELLESGGSLNIKASQNGTELKSGGYELGFKQSNSSNKPMALFQGSSNSGVTTWNESPVDSVQNTTIDSSDVYYLYNQVSSFNWINCDRFYNDPNPKTNVFINVNGVDFKYGECHIMMIFPDINSNSMMWNEDIKNPTSYSLGTYYKLPTGLNVKFIAIGMHKGKYYYGILENQTITNNFSNAITVSEKSKAEIKTAIEAL